MKTIMYNIDLKYEMEYKDWIFAGEREGRKNIMYHTWDTMGEQKKKR